MIITTSDHPTNEDLEESSNVYEKPKRTMKQDEFNWRKHISKNEKTECDKLINEIIKLPENINGFYEMLKSFQQFTG